MCKDNFVTIATYTYPTELLVIQGRLEAEGIECFVKDEYTVQVHNFLSNAIGGIKLQVNQSDVKKATEILEDAGISKFESDTEPSNVLVNLDKFTSQIPLINRIRLELRLIVLIAILLIVISILILLLTQPTTKEYLTQYPWCIESYTNQGKHYYPQSTVIWEATIDICTERLEFKSNGHLTFWGFNYPIINGKWSLKNEVLEIHEVDTFKNILLGTYKIEKGHNSLNLTSDKTTLLCNKIKF